MAKKSTSCTSSAASACSSPCKMLECVPMCGGSVWLAGNLLFAMEFLGVSPVILLISYGPMILLALGLCAKMTGRIKSETGDVSLEMLYSREDFSEKSTAVYDAASGVMETVSPLLTWKEPTTSFAVAMASYVFGWVACLIGIWGLVFLAFNVCAVFAFFGDEICVAAAPHVARAKKELTALSAKVPRYAPEKKAL
ncbi:unnamed protein product [Amoebophrya sp. A25]|nr:unnamed protein product [Amoebophrya sp. A25]|eukprot:GSA25T00016628001.1